MNLGQLNGFGLNASAGGGNNATLQGGFASTSVCVALLIGNAILTGGITNTPTTGGSVSRAVSGGTYSECFIDGTQFKTANLQGSIYSTNEVYCSIGRAPAFTDGVYTNSAYGGEIIGSTVLRVVDYVGDTNQVSASMSVVNGVLSQWHYGFDGTNSVGGNYKITAKLPDGIRSSDSVGHVLTIGMVLKGGLLQLNECSSPVLLVSPMLNGGIHNHTLFNAQAMLSPFSNSGVEGTDALGGKQRIGASLSDGIETTDAFFSIGLKATQRLPGGGISTGSVQGTQVISARLHEGIFTDSIVVGESRIGAKLQEGFIKTCMAQAYYRIDAHFVDGIYSLSKPEGNLQLSCLLPDGFETTNAIGGNRTAVSLTKDGMASTHQIGGDIVQGFSDPLLNTWALSLRSATPILSVLTPNKDV